MEVIMAALVKKTQSRISRWCIHFVTKHRAPQRWYEYNGPGMA
jgi:hypothetical protein